MTNSARALGAFAVAAALVGAMGCGNSCPTESPAKVDAIGSCSAKPGDTVSVPVRLCPTCNQSGATCAVDTSQASTGFIQLDPTVEACESASTCGSTAPACQQNPLTCTFTVPSNAASHVVLIVFDPSTNSQINGTLDVGSGVTPSCSSI